MSAGHGDPTVPRGALIFAGGLISFALLSAAAVRVGIAPLTASPRLERQTVHMQPIKTRDLTFADRADGGVTVTDVSSGRAAEVFAPLSNSGFIRGVMRGLARERRMHAVGSAPAFRLQSWPNHDLSLTDLATGRIIELGAFGPTNRAVFADLLAAA